MIVLIIQKQDKVANKHYKVQLFVLTHRTAILDFKLRLSGTEVRGPTLGGVLDIVSDWHLRLFNSQDRMASTSTRV